MILSVASQWHWLTILCHSQQLLCLIFAQPCTKWSAISSGKSGHRDFLGKQLTRASLGEDRAQKLWVAAWNCTTYLPLRPESYSGEPDLAHLQLGVEPIWSLVTSGLEHLELLPMSSSICPNPDQWEPAADLPVSLERQKSWVWSSWGRRRAATMCLAESKPFKPSRLPLPSHGYKMQAEATRRGLRVQS